MPTVGSLFSGIGGIDLGLERAGWTVRWQVERDEWCQRVLAKHWPDVSRFGDIKTFLADTECSERREITEGRNVSNRAHSGRQEAPGWTRTSGEERVDLIAGGFPCQPVSLAGRRRGTDDERWLWPEFCRVVRLLRPRYVLIENVPGVLTYTAFEGPRDRCLCGWPYRWRGMHLYRPGQAEGLDVPASRCGDDGEGDGSSGSPQSRVRRDGSDDPEGDRSMGSGDVLDPDWPEGDLAPTESESVFEVEDGAGATCTGGGRTQAIATKTSERNGSVDTGGASAGARDPRTDPEPEPEGAERDSRGRLVCPSCGRPVDLSAGRSLLSSGVAAVLGDLAALGYDAEWTCIPAAAVGAPHLRWRVFIVAYAERDDGRLQPGRRSRAIQGKQESEWPAIEPDRCGSSMAYAYKWRLQDVRRGGVFDREWSSFRDNADRCREWWCVEPNVGRVAHGVPARVDRLRGLGNAVVPQVAEAVGRMILEHW